MVVEQRVFIPQSIPDLFSILKRRPECMIWAGGTFIGSNPIAKLDSNSRDLISLQRIDELKRIYRTDRFIDLGATVTLERMLRLNESLLPASLRQAILTSVPAPARSLATLGGNLCISGTMLNLVPWMAIADARLEIRRQGSTRTTPANKFMTPHGQPGLEVGDILTRIRIPLGWWNHQVYRRIPADNDNQTPALAFCALAEIHKDIIEDIRIGFILSNMNWQVFPAADAALVGRRLPLSERDILAYAAGARKNMLDMGSINNALLEYRIEHLAAWYLKTLPRDLA